MKYLCHGLRGVIVVKEDPIEVEGKVKESLPNTQTEKDYSLLRKN